MITNGQLKVNLGVSRLNGTRLAITGADDPFGSATNFLANRGLNSNDFIFVDGTNGFVGGVPVIFITDAGRATVGAATKKASVAKVNKKVNKAAGKSGDRKGGAAKSASKKKRAAKKGGAKKPAKRAAKRSAKKSAGRKSKQ